MQVNRDGVSRGTFVDDKPAKSLNTNSTSKPGRVAELDLDDLYEPSNSSVATNPKISHFSDVCAQMIEDHKDRPKTRVVLQVIARIFGLTVARCASNVIRFITGTAWLDPRRDYAVLPRQAPIYTSKGSVLTLNDGPVNAEKLAQIYKPDLFTICEDQANDPSLTAVEMRYEVLPPRSGKTHYSIIYYVRREREHMPVVFLGLLLDLIRPLLWSTKSEWSAIEIDVDRDSGRVEKINCDSSNYTGDPLSYEITSANDLHLPVKVVRKNTKWSHTIFQKNNRGKTREISDPFEKDTHLKVAFVNWNGGMDLVGATQLLGYKTKETDQGQRLFKIPDVPLSFLDIQTYRREGIDLRNAWLERRKTGHCILNLPPRKEGSEFKVLNLVSGELPSLLKEPVSIA